MFRFLRNSGLNCTLGEIVIKKVLLRKSTIYMSKVRSFVFCILLCKDIIFEGFPELGTSGDVMNQD